MKTPDINQILRNNPRSCRYGSPMGARNTHESESPLYVQRVQLIDGDYAPDGTYWGASRTGHIWCAFNGEDTNFAPAMGSRIYVRARTRAEAIEAIREDYPNTIFKKV